MIFVFVLPPFLFCLLLFLADISLSLFFSSLFFSLLALLLLIYSILFSLLLLLLLRCPSPSLSLSLHFTPSSPLPPSNRIYPKQTMIKKVTKYSFKKLKKRKEKDVVVIVAVMKKKTNQEMVLAFNLFSGRMVILSEVFCQKFIE